MSVRQNRVSRARRVSPEDLTSPVTVSVVIPCFNYASYLPEAVASALDQPGVEVEVIIVDDASTDHGLAVARSMAADDPRVTVLANGSNRGPVETFNRGLASATGDFLVRLDADDLLTPMSLRRSAAVMQRFPLVGLVYGRPIHFEGDRLPSPRTVPRSWTIWEGSQWLAARCADGTNVITSPEAFMRRSVVDVVGGQRELAHTHDFEMWLRIAAHSDVAYIEGADQAWHRDHPGSLSTHAEEPLSILPEILAAFDVLLDPAASPPEGSDRLSVLAHRAIAREALSQAARRLDHGGASGDARALGELAVRSDPAIVDSAQWKNLDRRSWSAGPSSIGSKVRGLASRAGRRVRSRIRVARWERHGVYERVVRSRGRGSA